MRWQQVTERILWTFVQAATANITGAVLLDIAVWKMAAVTGGAAVVAAVSVYARKRLSVLPDPGDGLPGAEVSPRAGP